MVSDIPAACRMCPVCAGTPKAGTRPGDICDRIVGYFIRQATIKATIPLRDKDIPIHKGYRELMGRRNKP